MPSVQNSKEDLIEKLDFGCLYVQRNKLIDLQ